MTTTFHYDVGLVLDDNAVPLPLTPGIFRLATSAGPGAAAAVQNSAGDPTTIQTSRYGAFSRFQYVSADDVTGATGYLDFNGIIQPVASIEVLNALPSPPPPGCGRGFPGRGRGQRGRRPDLPPGSAGRGRRGGSRRAGRHQRRRRRSRHRH